MLLIIIFRKVQERLHIVTNVFALLPHHSNLDTDRRCKRNSDYARELISHTGIKKAAVLL